MLMGSRPTGFQPVSNPGYLYLTLEGPPGSTRGEMVTAVERATRMLLAQPDVARVYAQIGLGNQLRRGPGPEQRPLHRRAEGHAPPHHRPVQARIRPLLRQQPDVRLTNMGGGFGGSADIETVLASQNGPELERAQLELDARDASRLPQITEVRPSPMPAGPELVVQAQARRGGAARRHLRRPGPGAADRHHRRHRRRVSPSSAKASGASPSACACRRPTAPTSPPSASCRCPPPAAARRPLSSVADLTFEAGPARTGPLRPRAAGLGPGRPERRQPRHGAEGHQGPARSCATCRPTCTSPPSATRSSWARSSADSRPPSSPAWA